MRLRLFALLTIGGVFIFAVTITFVPFMPTWVSYATRVVLLIIFAGFWWVARVDHRLSCFRPLFFAYLTAILAFSLGFVFGDWGLQLFGLTTQTPTGIAIAKFSEASVIVIGVLVTTKLCGESLSSLYIRRGRLLLGLTVGLLAVAISIFLTLQQPATRTFGAAKFTSLLPWIAIFVVSNGFIEELVFCGLILGRYEPLLGRWAANLSIAVVFTLAHMQVTYQPDIIPFLVVAFVLSIAWGWLMQTTESLWGSALFHAGADLLIILPIFKSLGAF